MYTEFLWGYSQDEEKLAFGAFSFNKQPDLGE